MKFCQWEARRLFALAVPVFLAQVTLVLMSVTDTLMAGRYSPVDLAALSVSTGLWNPLMLTLQGLLLALTPMVAQCHGANDAKGIRYYFQQSLYLALLLSVAGLALAELAPAVIAMLDTQPKISALSRDYIDYVKFGLPGYLLYSVYRNLAEGKAYTKPALYISLLGLAINIPANYVFIYGKLGMPALGGAGCGLATALVYWVMGLAQWFFSMYSKRIDGRALLHSFAPPQPAAIATLVRIGLPLSLAMLFEVTLFACIPLFIAELGAIVVSGHQVAASVTTLLFMMPLSLSMAVCIRVGNLAGQQNYPELRTAANTSFVMAVLVALFVATVTYLGREMISHWFSDDPDVIVLASGILVLACLYQLPDALQVTASGILRGLKHTAPISYITFVSYWLIGFVLGYVLAKTDLVFAPMGAQGFWLGIIVGLSVAAVLLLFTVKKRLAEAPYNQV